MTLDAVVSAVLPAACYVMAAGHMIRINMAADEHKIFTKKYKRGSACKLTLTRYISSLVYDCVMAAMFEFRLFYVMN